jgi:hypothetical protein
MQYVLVLLLLSGDVKMTMFPDRFTCEVAGQSAKDTQGWDCVPKKVFDDASKVQRSNSRGKITS